MKTNYVLRYACNPHDVRFYDTDRLNEEFRISLIFVPDEINFFYSIEDRMIVGGAMPSNEILPLGAVNLLGTRYFLRNREMGIVNLGGEGVVKVDDTEYLLTKKDALFIGSGDKNVEFMSVAADKPAKFYFISTAAAVSYPDRKVTPSDAVTVMSGGGDHANACISYLMIGNERVPTSQLQMGISVLAKGSVWNNEPVDPHYHRLESFFIFDLPEGEAVCQFLGEPSDTRHIWLKGQEGVFIPEWSIHPAVGTSSFSVVWGKGGMPMDYMEIETGKESGLS